MNKTWPNQYDIQVCKQCKKTWIGSFHRFCKTCESANDRKEEEK